MSVQNRINRWEDIARRLTGVLIENRDATELIPAHDDPRAVIYCDPPYVAASRAAGAAYVQEMMGADAHRRLAQVLHACQATVLLSGYPSPLYDEIYKDWHRVEQRIVRRVSNRASAPQPHATEIVWSNRALNEGRLFTLVAEGA